MHTCTCIYTCPPHLYLHLHLHLHVDMHDYKVTNLHDWSSGDRYLTDHSYLCYLEQAEVRRALHVGDR